MRRRVADRARPDLDRRRSRSANPNAARVVAEPKLFPDGGNDGTSGTLRKTTGCHDITVYQEKGLAAGACTGQGVILDIRNPVRPKVLANIEDTNFAFWHSATISNDGKRVLFTDELGGGSAADVQPDGRPAQGADADLRHHRSRPTRGS